VAGIHGDIRASPDALNEKALITGRRVCHVQNHMASNFAGVGNPVGLTMGVRFIRLADYAGRELGRVLKGSPRPLGRARLALAEQVPPMSLHLGLVRLAVGHRPVLDVLYDTTDSRTNLAAFCCVSFDGVYEVAARVAADAFGADIGTLVAAY